MTRFVEKPWGGEEIFAETDHYVGKIISIRAGHALSLQYHLKKDETMRVLEGNCELHAGSTPGSRALEVLLLSPGSTVRIRSGVVHRVVALTDVRIIEVSTPEVADVVRLEDRYGREGTSEP